MHLLVLALVEEILEGEDPAEVSEAEVSQEAVAEAEVLEQDNKKQRKFSAFL